MQVHRPNEPFEILSNPEFLAEGTAINDLLNPPRIIIGSASTPSGRAAATTLASIYSWVPPSRIITTNTWSSELSKLVANAMLAQRISSINSISAICEKTGADIAEISESVGSDPRIGSKFLQAGIGFGGSCFRKDISSLVYLAELSKLVANAMLAQRISSINSISAICEKTGADIAEISESVGSDPRIGSKFLQAGIGFGGSCFRKDISSLVYLAETLGLDEVAEYWSQVLTINSWQRTRFIRRVIRCLNGTLVGKKLTILGYAFKKGTSDTRESPALECIKILLEEAPMEIAIYDPYCTPAQVTSEIETLLGKEAMKQDGGCVEVYSNVYAACESSSGLLILTDCDEFKTSSGSSEKSFRESRKCTSMDPRPFTSLEPTESELLALNKYLASISIPSTSTPDPLQRLHPEPDCPVGCVECCEAAQMIDSDSSANKNGAGRANISLQSRYHQHQRQILCNGYILSLTAQLDVSNAAKLLR